MEDATLTPLGTCFLLNIIIADSLLNASTVSLLIDAFWHLFVKSCLSDGWIVGPSVHP